MYFLENIVRYVSRGIPSLTGRQENLKLVASRERSTLRRNYELPMVMVVLIGMATSAFALSVEEAYRLIPHQRTVFQPASARMTASERAYLAAFFNAIEQAIIAKVSARRDATVAEAYAPVWRTWEELNPPTSLKAAQDKVKVAIIDQQAFLLEIEKKQSSWNLSHPKVRSSSANLQGAYRDLMRLYPGEGAVNRQAFFDYLCALDFI